MSSDFASFGMALKSVESSLNGLGYSGPSGTADMRALQSPEEAHQIYSEFIIKIVSAAPQHHSGFEECGRSSVVFGLNTSIS